MHSPIGAFEQHKLNDEDLIKPVNRPPFLGGKSSEVGHREKVGGIFATVCATGGSATCDRKVSY